MRIEAQPVVWASRRTEPKIGLKSEKGDVPALPGRGTEDVGPRGFKGRLSRLPDPSYVIADGGDKVGSPAGPDTKRRPALDGPC